MMAVSFCYYFFKTTSKVSAKTVGTGQRKRTVEQDDSEEDEENDSEVEKTQSKKSKMAATVGSRGKVVEKANPPKRSKLEEVSVGICVITCIMSNVWNAKKDYSWTPMEHVY